MSKKNEKMNDETLAAMSQVNPFEYGYKPEAGVTVSGAFFMALMSFVGAVGQNEAKEMVEVVAFKLGDEPKENDPRVIRVFTSPVGMQAEQIMEQIMSVHVENIEKGLAVSLSETAPKLDLGNAPKG